MRVCNNFIKNNAEANSQAVPMQTILLIVHLLIALSLVGVILLQRSEGGALGIGGSGGGGGNMFSARGTANLLTRTTAILAILFITTSMLLAITSGRFTSERRNIGDEINQSLPAQEDSQDQNAQPLVPFSQ